MINKVQPRLTITLTEWQSVHLERMELGPEDRFLASSISGPSSGRIDIDELKTGLRITARSWVGVVRFSRFEIRIVPKLAGGNMGLVRLIDFAGGLNSLERHPANHTIDAEGANLLDLVGSLFAEACERIVRRGLFADYRELEEDLPVVRGRLLIRKQMLKRFGRVDRVECRYDEHTTHTIENQIVLAALTICATRVQHPGVALRIRRLLGIFSEACSIDDGDLRLVHKALSYNRLNEHYREAHRLAWLLLDNLGIDDLYSGAEHRMFAFLLDMNRLFEDFISRWLLCITKGTALSVISQRPDRSILWNADVDKSYTKVRPDILIESKNKPGYFLPLDAKYKLYDQKNVTPADIYQTFLYAYAYGQHHPTLPTSIILYPASSESLGNFRIHVRHAGGSPHAELAGLGIDIPKALAEAGKQSNGHEGTKVLERIMACFASSSG